MAKTRSKKKILFLDHAVGEISGAEFSLLYLIRHLDKRRFLPIVACRRDGLLGRRLLKEGFRVVDITFPDLQKNASRIGGFRFTNPLVVFKNVLGLLKCTLKLTRVIRSEGVDIVHVNTMLPRLPGLLSAKLGGAKIIWHIRDFVVQRHWVRFYDWSSKFVDRVITVSDACRAQFSDKDGLITIYNGVDIRVFNFDEGLRAKFRGELGLDNGSLVVGCVGILDKRKGIEVFLEAAEKASRRVRNLKFVIVGSDPSENETYKRYLLEKAKSLRIYENVFFTGFRENVVEALSGLDIGVISSTRPDPFPRTVIEMMAVGIPVVGSSVGGIPEAIADGVTGFLAEPYDSSEFARRIELLAEDRILRERMKENARRSARERFSIYRNVEEIQKVYISLTS